MSNSTVSRVEVYRDYALSMLVVVCGRLYPTLHLPAADLRGKTAVVTGANSGIGLYTAHELVRMNATVYLACRNGSKAQEAVSQITSAIPNSVGRVKTLTLDTSSLSSVRECAREWKNAKSNIDILFHNAGIAYVPARERFTLDGFPLIYATNMLGSFLLTHLLVPYLSADARIIFNSSTANYFCDFTSTFSLRAVRHCMEPGFHAPKAAVKSDGDASDSATYGNVKAMQLAFAKLLQHRWDAAAKASGTKNRRSVHAFTPGYTMTPIVAKLAPRSLWEDLPFWMLTVTTYLATDVSQGAATAVWLATTNDEAVIGEGMGGGYWDRMTRRVTKVHLMSRERLEQFWIRWEADAGVSWR